jgi:hypothetical protein
VRLSRAAAESAPDQLGLDVCDAVPESSLGCRRAVVRLVRMQDVQLPGKTKPPAAAVTEALDAAGCDPDRVGVVPVRREGLCREGRLGALDRLGPASEPDPIGPLGARSFKTIGSNAS